MPATIRICCACGADNRPIARLCDQCGMDLSARRPPDRLPRERFSDLQQPGVLAARILNQAYSVAFRLIENRLRGTGISVAQLRALSIVKLMPAPLTPGLLAVHLALDARTASDLIGRLEQASWMRRVKDLPDRRASRLELTEQGEAVLARVWDPYVHAMDEVWNCVPREDVLPVIEVLIRLRDSCLERLGYAPNEIFALGPPSPVAEE